MTGAANEVCVRIGTTCFGGYRRPLYTEPVAFALTSTSISSLIIVSIQTLYKLEYN